MSWYTGMREGLPLPRDVRDGWFGSSTHRVLLRMGLEFPPELMDGDVATTWTGELRPFGGNCALP